MKFTCWGRRKYPCSVSSSHPRKGRRVVGGAWRQRLLPPLMSLNIWWGLHALAVISLAWIISAGKIHSVITKFMYDGKGSKLMKQDVHVTRWPIKAAVSHLYSFPRVWLAIHMSSIVFLVFSPLFLVLILFSPL